MTCFRFKESNSFEKRRKSSGMIMKKYKKRIPAIIEVDPSSRTKLPQLDKSKYLIPKTMEMAKFQALIRDRLSLHRTQAIFFFVNASELLPPAELAGRIYEIHKDKDGFLYISLAAENAFGLKKV